MDSAGSTPVAAYKDMCIDSNDPLVVGKFWADALDMDFHTQDNGDAYLTGSQPEHKVWINRVPESQTGKNRVHLDVHGTAPEPLVEAGATVVDGDSFRWVIMADPEGTEFCLFRRDEVPPYRVYEVVVNVGEQHREIADWWASLLGGQVTEPESGYSYVTGGQGVPFECICFIPVPEAKTVKNRIHFDFYVPDLSALEAAGATLLRAQDDEIAWSVWSDPFGNEFCAFDPAD